MKTLVFYVALPLVLLLIVVGLLFFQKQDIDIDPRDKTTKAADENQLAQARAALGKNPDLPTCRGAVQQLNAHLMASRGKVELPPLAAAQEIIQQELKLPEDDYKEAASPTFTPLDAYHLEACFLLRDAARSLDLSGPAGRRKGDEKAAVAQLDPLRRAELAFEWVVRQVRLQAPPPPLPGQPEDTVPTPPAWVLRRGSGTPLERALVFLALLEQFSLDDDARSGLQGVLIYCPDANKQKRFWACGVTIGGQPGAVYLFDPRLGLPLPGAGGKGIATLADAVKALEVLGQLQADAPAPSKPKGDKPKADKPEVKKLVYDVTPEQARQAELFLATPLSALAPRMLLLQEKLLRDREVQGQLMPAPVRARLAEEDAKATRARLEKLTGAKVKFLPEAVTHLRRFMPREEGGNDPGVAFMAFQLEGFASADDQGGRKDFPRKGIFELRSVPWEDFPPELRQQRYDLGLGRHIRNRFMAPFLRPLNDPASARQLLVRGRFLAAVQKLMEERDLWSGVRGRAETAVADLPQQLAEWLKKATAAYAAALRDNPTIDDAALLARVKDVWGQGHAIDTRLSLAMAAPREAQVLYQLALCKHEQAVRQQVQYLLAEASKVAQPEEARKLARAWESAENFWRDYVEANDERSVASEDREVTLPARPEVPSAKRLRAEALARYTEVMDGIVSRKELAEGKLKEEQEKRPTNLAEAQRLLREVGPGQSELEVLGHLLLARRLPPGQR